MTREERDASLACSDVRCRGSLRGVKSCRGATPPIPWPTFFRGKTIRLVVPTGPGGAYGLYGLLFAQHFGRHLPGEPVVLPEYRSGAGGVVAANYLYSVAPNDGTVIGIPLAPIILGQYTGGSSAQYDASKFAWLGQMANITRLFTVWETSKVKRFGSRDL